MVCGLCHRPDTDHSLSTSGPQRCKYNSHREHCPGGFRTKCTNHNALPSDKSEYFIDDELLNAIDNITINGIPVQPTTPSNELMSLSANQLQWLGIQPDQLQQIAQIGVHLGQQAVKHDPQAAVSPVPPLHIPQLPMSAPPAAGTPLHRNAPLPPPSSLPWGSQATSSSVAPPCPTSAPLAGIEQLVRNHVAQNQHTLQQYSQQANPPSYTGPTLPEIRQDPKTQQQVSTIMDLLKNASPVFQSTTSTCDTSNSKPKPPFPTTTASWPSSSSTASPLH